MNELSTENNSRGIVFDIQRAAMHDGPGIRTTVFLKGCPLRCAWCHNPESWSLLPQEADPVRPGDLCVIFGKELTVDEIMKEVRKDRIYYETSGGGLTISGGEPTVQFEFCRALLRAARREGFHTCLDTCGHNQPGKFLELLPYVSLFLWDYKATGSALHRKLTGVSSELIRKNFEMLYERGASILLRAPLVPEVNDTEEHFQVLARLLHGHPRLAGVELLPYHDIGLGKYDRLHLPRPKLDTHPPDAETRNRWVDMFRQECVRANAPFPESAAAISMVRG